MSFEKHLLRGIPLEEAAGFFLRVRGKDKSASVALDFNAAMAALPAEERAALLKSATMAGAPPAAAAQALPATAKGQQMQPPQMPALPPTAMGQNTTPGMKMAMAKSPQEAGVSRARANFAAGLEKDRLTRGERILGGIGSVGLGVPGLLAGGGGGIMAGEELSRHLPNKYQLPATVGLGLLGAMGGGALGHSVGKGLGRWEGHALDAHRFRKLPQEGAVVPEEKVAEAFKLALQETPGLAPPALPGIEPALDPETQQMLMMQQQGDQAAEQGESAYLRQQLEALRQESSAAMEQAQQAQEQQEMVEQQQSQYQAQVADATQKAMEAQDQVLQQQQAAAAMRMAFQELRGKMLEAASAEPPSLTPTIGSQAEAAAASQAAGPSSAPPATAGPAGAAPNPGVPPAGMAPEGDDTVSTPAAKNEPTFEGAQSTTSMNQKEPSGDAQIPNKEVLSHYLPLAKTADLRAILSQIGSQVGEKARAAAPYALGGALLGGGAGALESQMSNEPLRSSVAELEAKPDRGYKDTLNLAQKRARLTVGDFAKEHPGVAIGMGALGGASFGATRGPGIVSSLKRQGGYVKGIGNELKTIFQKGAA